MPYPLFPGLSGGRRVHGAGEGVMEITYPFFLKGKPVHKMEIWDILNLENPGNQLIRRNDEPRLRYGQDYYA